jgi:UDP-N-acetylmuramoyl-tripeptide--D-alanyl-D-alanine ligase
LSALWTSSDAEAATLGQATVAFTATGMSIDTRSLRPGDLFVALQGENRDGHAFVAAALKAKAAAALVSRKPSDVSANAPLLLVASTQRALEDLACASRARTDAKLVAVTGSAGKTTTKEMLRLALAASGTVHASYASFNNHWGVPLSLASMPRDVRFGVFEIGMNHAGEIRPLVGFVRPHVALITMIGPAHLEFFHNCEAIADAKSEIFESLVQGGAALLPSDSPYFARLRERARQAGVARILSFGEEPGSDARLLSLATSAQGIAVKADIFGQPVEIHIPAPGRHLALNAIAALAATLQMGGDIFNAAAALRSFAALEGRGARFDAAGVQVIDESYNANPASTEVALQLLAAEKGRRIAVLGDMLELGAEADALHAGLAHGIENARVDLVFVNGTHMKALWDVLPSSRRGAYAETSEALAPQLLAALKAGDTVLVKGSKGSKMGVVIDALKARG